MNPQEIQGREFLVGIRGYDRDEVDAFLAQLAEEHGRVLAELEALRAATPEETDPLEELGANVTAVLRSANEAAATITAEAEELLELARREADELRAATHAEAERIVAEAQERARAAEAAGEARGRERAAEAVEAASGLLDDIRRKQELVRARLAETSDEIQLALLALGDPVGEPVVDVSERVDH